MFDIGFSELVLIGMIALIVLGPKRLPEVARSAGQWMGKLRRFVENVKRDIDKEIKDEDLAAFRQMHAELNETREMLQRSTAETFATLSADRNSVALESSSTSESVESPAATPASSQLEPAKPRRTRKKASIGETGTEAIKPRRSRATGTRRKKSTTASPENPIDTQQDKTPDGGTKKSGA